MTTSGGVGGVNVGGITSIDISNMDLETALMAVQSQRTQLLDQQIQVQIKEVQARNDKIAALNNVLSALNKATAQFKSDAKPTDTIPGWNQDKINTVEVPLNDAIKAAGLGDLGFTSRTGQMSDPNKPGGTVLITGPNVMAGGTTKAELDAAVSKVKGMIDSVGNSQQMDMLRLQSMTGKRNEAFDVMTNFVKKQQDSRSGIIGNMR
jgi:hypothetical protein